MNDVGSEHIERIGNGRTATTNPLELDEQGPRIDLSDPAGPVSRARNAPAHDRNAISSSLLRHRQPRNHGDRSSTVKREVVDHMADAHGQVWRSPEGLAPLDANALAALDTRRHLHIGNSRDIALQESPHTAFNESNTRHVMGQGFAIKHPLVRVKVKECTVRSRSNPPGARVWLTHEKPPVHKVSRTSRNRLVRVPIKLPQPKVLLANRPKIRNEHSCHTAGPKNPEALT
jgi:hypothetical protein